MRTRVVGPFVLPGACALALAACLLQALAVPAHAAAQPSAAQPAANKDTASQPADTLLLDAMTSEMQRALADLGRGDTGRPAPKPYFLSYSVSDADLLNLNAEYGAITVGNSSHIREADVQVRLGSPALDNTHGDHRTSALTSVPLPLGDDREAIQRSLWYATNQGYGKALDALAKVRTEQSVRAREEDTSADFSQQQPDTAELPAAPPLHIDRASWEARLRAISAEFRKFPVIYYDTASLQARSETDYFVSSEGTRVTSPSYVARLVVVARTRAADGMDLFRVETFESDDAGHLPPEDVVMTKVRAMAADLVALRTAPITEPYNGPAILSGRAAAVFFHEVLGHRLEGQRQRGDEEGQTFTRLLGKPILPSFLSVADDPTLRQYNGEALSGFYHFDDEGQPAQRVQLVDDGVLKTFLMSRQPVASFGQSNGHGRAQAGKMPTGRQGNLIVTSTKTVGEAQLRDDLKAAAKRAGKAYGLYFADISSGFAVTTRRSPQAFQVIPLVVYRVYVDGRPDELVRGVSIVGTPQAALNSIVVTGDTDAVFNGECGAESGTIPVSAVAPAMLVSAIETQKQAQGTARPPIVPPPPVDPGSNAVPGTGITGFETTGGGR